MHEEDVIALVRYAKPGATGWYRMNCPACVERTGKADAKASFGLSAGTGFYHCFKCGIAGRVKSLIDEAYTPRRSKTEERTVVPLPDDWFDLGGVQGLGSRALEPVRDYMLKRHVPVKTWQEVGIGVTMSGYYANRVIVPVFVAGEVLGWVARDWTGYAEKKYLYPKGMRRGQLLFNHDALFQDTSNPIIVVEGVFDALPYWPDAVACLGKPTEEQTQAMIASNRPLAIALDGDAHLEGWGLAMRLAFEGKESGYVRLPPRKDPNDVNHDWLRAEARRCIGDGQCSS